MLTPFATEPVSRIAKASSVLGELARVEFSTVKPHLGVSKQVETVAVRGGGRGSLYLL